MTVKTKEDLQRKNELKIARNKTVEFKKEQELLIPKIRKVRLLDEQIRIKKESIDKEKVNYEDLDQKITKDKKEAEQKRTKLTDIQKEVKDIQEYLQSNAQDESLISQLPAIKTKFISVFSTMKEDISKKTNSIKENEEKLNAVLIKISDNDRQLKSFEDKYDQINNQIQLEEAQLKELLKGCSLSKYRREKDDLWKKMTFLNKITDLKSERNNLKDGRPCPLCGSKDHPYVNKNSLPDKSETEKKIDQLTQLIKKAEDIETKIKKYEKSKEQYSGKCNSFEKEKIQYMSQKKNCENNLENLRQEITDQNRKFEESKGEILNQLKSFGIQEVSEENINLLGDRLEKWKKQKQCEEKIKEQRVQLEGDLKSLNSLIKNNNPLIVKKGEELKSLEKEYREQRTKRQDLFGDKDPDRQEERLTEAISKADQTEQSIQSEYNKIQRDIHSIKDSIKSLEKNISKRNDELQDLEIAFKNRLKSSDFIDEQDFKDNRLSAGEQMQLANKEQELDNKKTGIKAKKEGQEEALTQETNKKVTQLTAEDLKLSQKKT